MPYCATMLKRLFAKRILTSNSFTALLGEDAPHSRLRQAEMLDRAFQKFALTQADAFTKKQWDAIQNFKLKRIIEYARRTVPYWRRLFMSAGFSADYFDCNELYRIPPLTRSVIKQTPIEEMLAQDLPASRFIRASTSGSTGEPLGFFIDRNEVMYRTVNTLQEMRYAGARNNARVMSLGLVTHRDLDALGCRIKITELEDAGSRAERLYPFFASYKPQVLITTPSYLKLLVYAMKTDGFRYSFELILCRGEHIEKDDRDSMSHFFSCPIFSVYGSKECSLVGIECTGGMMHLAPWMNYVEIVDDSGRSLPYGREGVVTATLFENKVMPFIRYQLGDRGILLDSACPCGRNTPHIQFRGRVSDMIDLPGERKIPVIELGAVIANKFSKHILQFQFEQKNSFSIFFNYSSIKSLHKTVADALAKELDGRLHPAKVYLKKVDTFQVNQDGKCPLLARARAHLVQ